MTGTITVLYTRFGEFNPIDDYNAETAFLPPEQRNHCWRYKKTIDRQRCIAGKILLLKCLENHGISSNALRKLKINPYGKPYVPAPLEFNISHSGRIAICAASKEPCTIGIDIEEMVGVDLGDFKETFNPTVFGEIVTSADPTSQFYKSWTAIESAMKADGRGMELPASEIIPEFQPQRIRIGTKSWNLYPLLIDSDYACHLTTDIADADIAIEQIQIRG